MYSQEIQQLLELRNYLIESKEYLEAFNPSISTQISRLRYNPFNNDYECWTNDNYYWKFKVYRKEKV